MTSRTGSRTSHSPTARQADGALEQASLDRLQAVHDTLTRAVADLAHGDAWQRMLRTAARFHHYSPHNVLLITAQCPQAQAVAGYRTWKQLDRQVRQGEKGIAILAPVVRRRTPEPGVDKAGPRARVDEALNTIDTRASNTASNAAGSGSEPSAKARRLAGFRVVHVFDISQTDGPPLPTQPLPELLEGHAPDGLLDALAEQVTSAGYRLMFAQLSVPHPGLAGANGVTDYLARTVTVRPDLSPAQTVKTLAHELGHVLLHAPDLRPASLTREQAEVEAESVAYVVAAAHGLDSSSYTIPYVTGWASADLDLIRGTAERVLGTARQVLTAAPPTPTFALHERPDGSRALEPASPTRMVARPEPSEHAVTHDVTRAAEPPIDRSIDLGIDRSIDQSIEADSRTRIDPENDPDVDPVVERVEPAACRAEAIDLSYADQATPPSASPPCPEGLGQQLLFLCDPEPSRTEAREMER